MANNKRTIYLGLDYSQFTGGVTEINRKMSLLDAEFKLATQQAKNYGTETDTLGVKQDYLTQKIALQTQKVEAAKKAYDEAMSSNQASQKEIDELDRRLLNERTRLEQLNGELEQTKQDTDSANKSNQSFGDTIRGLASSLGLSVSPALEAVAKKFDGISAATGKAILGIGAIVTGFIKCSKAAAETADELKTLSSTTGMTTTEIQKLQYASDFVDVSFETMSSSVTKLTTQMNKARNGSKDTEEAFRKLHIRIKDGHGKLRDANDVFLETIDALGKIKNETERDALAMELFGKSAKELNPLIEAGSKKLKEYGDEAENLGRLMSEDEIDAAAAFQDSLDKLDKSFESLKLSLGQSLLPILTTIADLIASIPTPVLKIIAIAGTLIATITMLAKAIVSIKTVMTAVNALNAAFQATGTKTVAIVLAIVAALIALAAIIAVIVGKKNDIDATMNSVQKTTEAMGENVTKASNTANRVGTAGRQASGTDSYPGGRTWVGEEGPEIVELPKGSRVIPSDKAAGVTNNYYYFTIEAKTLRDFTRVVEMADQMQMATRRA